MTHARLDVDREKVGIVTINDDANYGNRLQNYALQEVVRGLGWDPETLRNRPPRWDPALLGPRMLHELRHDPADVADRLVARVRRRPSRDAASAPEFLGQRRAAIAAFARDHIASSMEAFSDRPTTYWGERYSAVIAGSDQVWNPTYRRAQGIDFLDFAPESRRVAYAASFGVERVPGFLRSRYRTWLRGIPHLSVRESAGRRIVADLTGAEVPIVLDPTLLVEPAVWDRLTAARPRIVSEPYALRFFLGAPTVEQDVWVRRYASDEGLAVVDLHDLDDARFAEVDPAGFVASIARAEVVITDSFHAGIFSLLHRRPLILRTRFERDARWNELLRQHDLTTRATGIDGLRALADVDWTGSEQSRDDLRIASLRFLREALEASGERTG
ncbi:polysaccharide pyruvyl transferase family protein [Agromyces sp. NPDC056523]|uniref:polysaccharide pyruvyl transferase family protein n=1 Tax=Agromyces sp. NPDC056523 TaxID=3345850 RepID=UPI00366B55B6